jgi:lysophospholipase L1-like esterase
MKNTLLLASLLLAACGGNSGNNAAPLPIGGTAVPSVRDPNTIAFMGDSITFRWFTIDPLSMEINGKTLVDYGVTGETSLQMATRFQSDVIDSVASTVVILAGTNDVLQQSIGANIDYVSQMALSARDAGLTVILCEIPPQENMEAVVAYNAALIQFAKDNDFQLVDYYDALLPSYPNDTVDGIHPTDAGYTAMWAVLLPDLE